MAPRGPGHRVGSTAHAVAGAMMMIATSKLVVFCKAPSPGRVKTRLARSVGEEAATSLAWALLEDTLRAAAAAAIDVGSDLEVRHAPDAPGSEFRAWLRERAPGARLVAQGTGDLGARLARALEAASGARVVIGSDAPEVSPALLARALREATPGRAALGPALDGGFYLLGLGRGVAAGFLGEGIRWSSAHALLDVRSALERARVPIGLLPALPDVDEVGALLSLAARIALDPGAATSTASWLAARRDLVAAWASSARAAPP